MSFDYYQIIPIKYILQSEHRIYYGYILLSILIAYFYFLFTKKSSNKSFFKYFFNPKVLFSKSSRDDLILFFINHWLKFFLLAPFVWSSNELSKFTNNYLNNLFQNFTAIEINKTVYAVLYSLMFFVVSDFSRFFVHYLFHSIPLLWHFHKTHHSATVMTPLTLYRMHPFESIAYFFRQIITAGLFSGIFTFIFAGPNPLIMIMGVHLFGFIFNIAAANLRHSHVPISFGSFIETYLISPRMHIMHHSVNINQSTKNLGTFLTIWDHLFKTYNRPDEKPIRFGLETSQRKNFNPLKLW